MNVTMSEKLPEIFSLARDRSEAGRLRLATMLADIFRAGVDLNDREKILLNEIIDELIGNANPRVREMLAQRLADTPGSCQAPHRVLLTLACDPQPEVAGPVLRTAPLKDDDLIFVVEAHGTPHALAIAERAQISETVVDALVATGEISVMTAVAENLGAKISSHAMNVLVEAARFTRKLQENLVQRPELTLDMGIQLYWWLETEMRRTVVRRFGITSGQVEEALEHSISDLLNSISGDRNEHAALEKVVEWFAARDALNPRVYIQCLRMGFFRLFSVMLAHQTGLDLPLVEGIVAEDGGRSLAVLCRSINVDKPSFVSIFLLSRGARPGEQIVNPRELSQAITAFDRLSTTDTQRVLESWRQDPSYLTERQKGAIQ